MHAFCLIHLVVLIGTKEKTSLIEIASYYKKNSFLNQKKGGPMKIFHVLSVMFVALFTISSFAQNNQNNGPMGDGRMGGGMGGGMGCGMMDSSMCNTMMRMHMSTPKAAFATTDGGLIIIMGNKIMKYDKDLNLKKEANIKIDSSAMKNMMRQCPSMKSKQGSADSSGMNK